MLCQTCGFQNAATARQCFQCGTVFPNRPDSGSKWTWFFAGTTLVLGFALFGLIWTIASTGLYGDLASKVRERLLPSLTVQAPVITGNRELRPSGTPLSERPPVRGEAPISAPSSISTGTPTAVSSAGSTPLGTSTIAASTPTPLTALTVATPSAVAAGANIQPLGSVIESGVWRLVARDAHSESTPDGLNQMVVDLTIKNDSPKTALIVLPSTSAGPARSRLVTLPMQLADPPSVQLRLVNASGQFIGGSFRGSGDAASGGYNFYAAPGDAIRLAYVFPLPAGGSGPYRLDISFGVDAGGARSTVALDRTAPNVATLLPNDPAKIAGKEERITLPGLWGFTVASIDVGESSKTGEKTVSAKLIAENLSDRALVIGATREDSTGAERDFYVTDHDGNLAYSSSNSMPTATIPAKATRTVTIQLKAPKEFSDKGPFRLSIVVDVKRDRSAVFLVK